MVDLGAGCRRLKPPCFLYQDPGQPRLLPDCRNSQISIAVSDALDPTLGPAEGPAIGGNPVVMKGLICVPTDISRRLDSGIH